MATAAAGRMNLPLPVRLTYPTPKLSAGEKLLHRSQSACNVMPFQPDCFGQLSSLSVLKCHREFGFRRRNELCPLLYVCQHHARRSSASASASASASPGPALVSQDAEDSHSSEPNSSTLCGNHYGVLGLYAAALGGVGLFFACALQFPEASLATATVPATGTEASFPTVMTFAGAEPSNALSLPTWVIHVASVVEWVTAMALVWKYGDTEGKSAWKGLTWGMVPLLGGAMCACTWHFFYNAESLEVLVVLQAFLTVVGNFTMWAAAYRIWKLSQDNVTVD